VTVELNYREQGSGEPLLILHGLFGSAANWGRIARELARDHRVIVADLRNHGRSPHADEMTYEAMAADVAALIERLSPERPLTLIGHSMGGKAAMRLALTRPQLLARLVVVDIAPRGYRGNQDAVFSALHHLDPATLASRAEADARLAQWLPDPALRAFLLANLVQEEGVLRWRVNLPALTASVGDIEGFPVTPGTRYRGPTLFVAGRESSYLDEGDPVLIRQFFPQAAIDWIDGAGHWVHAERPDAFLAAVRRFLAA
jgi:pimeloyl-ACP methyl ester carboxylesterase